MIAVIPSDIWSTAAGSGFNAVLVMVLLYFGRETLRRVEMALDRNSRSITTLMLSISAMPEAFRRQAEMINKEIDSAEAKRNASPDSRG